MMKRFLCILSFHLILFHLIAVSPKEVTFESIPVEFTSGITHYAGFVEQRVSGTIKPAESLFLKSIPFDSLDESGRNYTTDDFYFFMQIFDLNPVAVDIISASPLMNENGDELNYINNGSNTVDNFKGSDADISNNPIEVFSEAKSGADWSKPRPENLRFNFSIPLDSIKASGQYTGSITLRIRTES